MQIIRFGNISAMDLTIGTVDVKFPDRVATGLWILDSVRTDTLAIDAPVVCAFPTGNGEGVCLGRHYNQSYPPGPDMEIQKNVKVTGALDVNSSISTGGNITAVGNISAINFP